MAANSFGQIFRLTTFGESHGTAVGGVIDGAPAGMPLDFQAIQHQLNRRKPGQSQITTARNEKDEVKFISGIFEGKTSGAPIAFWIENGDAKSSDYDALKEVFRPGHADYTYAAKYGIRDHRGGGRSSARTLAPWVVAGAIANHWLKEQGIVIQAGVTSVGRIEVPIGIEKLDFSEVDNNVVRCPDTTTAQAMEAAILQVKEEGDSLGGVISCKVIGLPVGLGEPQFLKLPAVLAHAMFSINAVKGFEIGEGFSLAQLKGSQANDAFVQNSQSIETNTNRSGGVLGGISNGMPLYFKVAFKPTSTISIEQQTVNQSGDSIRLQAAGRHDPCVLPRAVPIVEAMTALVLMDAYLMQKMNK